MKRDKVGSGQFFKQLLLLIGINLLVKPIYIFGVDVGVYNAVGAETYGIYWVLVNFVYLFSIFNDLGLQQYNHRFISQHPVLLKKYLPKFMGFKFGLSFLFTAVVLLISYLFGYLQLYPLLLAFIIGNQILNSFLLHLRGSISGLGHYTTDSILSIVDKLCMILLCGGVLLFAPSGMSISLFVGFQCLSFVITIACCLWILRSEIKSILQWNSLSFKFSTLRKSLPYALVVSLMLIYLRIDAVMLEKLHPDGAYQSGIYAAGYRILDAINMLGYLFAGLLLPMYARNISLKESVFPLIRMGLYFLLLISMTVAIVSYFYNVDLILFLFTEAQASWGAVFFLMILTFIPRSLDYVYGTLLVSSGNVKKMNAVYVSATILNILLNLWLIPEHGARGAALTSLICQGFVAIALIAIVHRLFKDISFVKLWKNPVLFVLSIVALALLILWQSEIMLRVGMWTGMVLIVLLSIILAYLCGILRVRELYHHLLGQEEK